MLLITHLIKPTCRNSLLPEKACRSFFIKANSDTVYLQFLQFVKIEIFRDTFFIKELYIISTFVRILNIWRIKIRLDIISTP